MATNDSRKSKAQLIQELNLLRGRTKAQSIDPVEEKAREIESRRVEAAVEGMTVETAVGSITAANLDVSRVLADAQERVIQKVKELEDVDKAIEAKKSELRELHDKDIIASSAAALLAEYDSKKKQLAADLTAFESDISNKQINLQRELDSAVQQSRFQISNDHIAMKQKQVEEHRNAEVQFQDELRQRKMAARDEEERRVRDWALREESLKKAEAELLEMRAKVLAFPEELKKAVARDVAIVTNTLTKDHNHAIALMDSTTKSAAALAAQTIKGLEAHAFEQAAVIEKLRTDLAASNQRITEIATKALDASSGALARDTLLQDRAAGRDGQGARAKS